MTNQAGRSRVDTVLKMLLITFISLLAFSSGVWFGKQMSDSDYQLKALEGDFTQSTMKTANRDHQDDHHESYDEAKKLDVAPEDALMAEDVAALSEKYVEAEKDNLDAEDTMKPTDAHAQHAKPDLSAAHKAAHRVANNQAPTEPSKEKAEKRVPSSLPKTVGPSADVEFTVQVASYPTADAAKSHAEDLVNKGYPAFPVEANIKGRTWYRVSVGSFKTHKEATGYRVQLLKQAHLKSAIVQRIQR